MYKLKCIDVNNLTFYAFHSICVTNQPIKRVSGLYGI